MAAHQKTIDDLTIQLDDLVKAKKSHQDEMLRKFAALLNTKKLKIRDQQRLLAHAKVQQARSGTAARKPDSSRASKRKVDASSLEPETDDEGFERTDLGNRMNEEDDNDEPLNSDKSDLDTEDDDDSDGGFAPAPMPSQPSQSQARSQVSVGAKGKASETAKPKEARTAPTKSPEIQLPPRRQLPFSKGNATSATQSPPRPAAIISPSKPLPTMDDDDETDDEL